MNPLNPSLATALTMDKHDMMTHVQGRGAGGAGGATALPNIQMFCIATIYTSPIQPPQ